MDISKRDCGGKSLTYRARVEVDSSRWALGRTLTKEHRTERRIVVLLLLAGCFINSWFRVRWMLLCYLISYVRLGGWWWGGVSIVIKCRICVNRPERILLRFKGDCSDSGEEWRFIVCEWLRYSSLHLFKQAVGERKSIKTLYDSNKCVLLVFS